MIDDSGPRVSLDPILGVGVLTLVATAAGWVVADNPTTARLVQAILPSLLGVVLVAYGLRRPAPDEPSDRRVLIVWGAIGIVTFVLIGVWFFVVGATFETAYWLAVVSSLSVGAALGLLIGLYAVQLRVSNRRLEERTERLEQFASIVSHDLRNPLSVARGRLDLARTDLAESDVDDATLTVVDEQLGTVDDAHDRMERLTDRLLELAREGTAVENRVPLDLASVARERWETVETDDAGLVTDVDRRVLGDRDRVGQLFENLFRNAVEHGSPDRSNPGGSSVTVTVGSLEDGFYVEDDGPGIPPEDRDRVFESGESDAGGTGLGLAIVERVADAHDWTVTITEGSDGGARFEVRGVETPDPPAESPS